MPTIENLTNEHQAAVTGAIQELRLKRAMLAHASFGGGRRAITPNDKPTPAAASYTKLANAWNPVFQQLYAPAAPAGGVHPVAVETPAGAARPGAIEMPAAAIRPELVRYNKPPAPQNLPTQIGPLIWNPITFDGFETHGQAQLTLYQNGGFNFNGSFTDPSAWDYDDSLAWGIVSSKGVLFTFSHSGSMHGWSDRWIEGGSDTDSWSNTGSNGAIAGAWADLCAGYHWQAEAGINFDIGGLETIVQDLIKVIQVVAAVIAVVA